MLFTMEFNFSQFVDIHNHILPGIDDGPADINESVALGRCYSEMGVRSLITTPHFIPGTAWAQSPEGIIAAIKNLNQIFIDQDIFLTVQPGMEIAYHKKLIERFSNNELLPLGNSKHYLLEPTFSDSQGLVLNCAAHLVKRGAKVIIAHPERITSFQETIDPLLEMSKDDIEIQTNIGSLLGKFGEQSRRVADLLLEEDRVHYLASDAHGANRRRPPTPEEWHELEIKLGNKLLTELCIINPAKLQ